MSDNINFSDMVVPVKKIAVMNPYLQGGHTKTAEMESTARFIRTATKRSIEVKVCATHEEVDNFKPDFVFALTYQEPKLTKYPTYLSVNIAVSMIQDVPRFVRNILTYDAFLTLSPSVVPWLQQLCAANHKMEHIAPGYFTLPQTEFKSCDYKNAVAMYMGTNWDGQRHNALFTLLNDGQYLKCYGPEKSWEKYPKTLYGGEVPFDGVSPLEFYYRHAAGLCIGYPALDEEGIGNNRMFEIIAASALPICSPNELTKWIYDDSVLYLTKTTSTQELANQIVTAVQWIRKNPMLAEAMARKAHAIFNEKYSMEVLFDKLLALHQRVTLSNGFNRIADKVISYSHHQDELLTMDAKPIEKSSVVSIAKVEKPKVAYVIHKDVIDTKLVSIFQCLKNQYYQNIEIIVITKNCDLLTNFIRDYQFQALPVHCFLIDDQDIYANILKYCSDNNIEWLGILASDDRLFPNHTSLLIDRYLLTKNQISHPISAIYSGSLEYSNDYYLIDKLSDPHKMIEYNKSRFGMFDLRENAPLCTFLFSADILNLYSLKSLLTNKTEREKIINNLIKNKEIAQTGETTCAVNYNKWELVQEIGEFFNANLDIYDIQRSVKAIILEQKQIINEQKKVIDQFFQSRTWRYTQPIRTVLRMFKKVIKFAR